MKILKKSVGEAWTQSEQIAACIGYFDGLHIGHMGLVRNVVQLAAQTGLTPALIKQAAPITVSTYEEASVRRHCEPILWHRGCQGSKVESDFFLLLAGHEGCYQPDMGLRLDSFNMDGDSFIF